MQADSKTLLSLLGQSDSNLRHLEKSLGISIFSRGNKLVLESPSKTKIRKASRSLNQIILKLKNNSKIPETASSLQPGMPRMQEYIVTHSLRETIAPRTPGQLKYCQALEKNDIVFVIGPAGTGKTYLAVAMAIHALRQKLIDRIVLVRPVVEAGENLGFLPGTFKEKLDPYLQPLYDAIYDMLTRDEIKSYFSDRIIEIAPLAYMRGRTLNTASIILDEAQNTTLKQMKMFLTRIGNNTKSIINGDITQIDLANGKRSGLVKIREVIKDIRGIKFIELTTRDVVRHPLVKKIIKAYSIYEEQNDRDS